MKEVEIALWKHIKIFGPSWGLVTLVNMASYCYDFFVRFFSPAMFCYTVSMLYVGLDVFLATDLCKIYMKN